MEAKSMLVWPSCGARVKWWGGEIWMIDGDELLLHALLFWNGF